MADLCAGNQTTYALSRKREPIFVWNILYVYRVLLFCALDCRSFAWHSVVSLDGGLRDGSSPSALPVHARLRHRRIAAEGTLLLFAWRAQLCCGKKRPRHQTLRMGICLCARCKRRKTRAAARASLRAATFRQLRCGKTRGGVANGAAAAATASLERMAFIPSAAIAQRAALRAGAIV